MRVVFNYVDILSYNIYMISVLVFVGERQRISCNIVNVFSVG